MTTKTEQLAQSLIDAVRGVLHRHLTPIAERLKTLEARPNPQQGPMGDKGESGERGEKGEPGLNGNPGERGEPGPVGERGEQGEIGPRGEKGEHGERGEPGPHGIHGETGANGIAGDAGAPGSAGEKGDPGDPGRDGRDGEAGRDAVHVDVLPGIEATKRYQRGTFAVHRGGLVRAFRATDPLPDDPLQLEKAGWHTVLRGVHEVAIELGDDQRTVTLRTAYTDGQAFERSVQVPTMIYRGVWHDGNYLAGDSVTRDGSVWIAKCDTSTSPGLVASDWQLAVKKGRDGRDGIKGEKGDRGAEGRAGHDLNSYAGARGV